MYLCTIIFLFNNNCFNDVRTIGVCPNNNATNDQESISTNITLSAYHRLLNFSYYCFLMFLLVVFSWINQKWGVLYSILYFYFLVFAIFTVQILNKWFQPCSSSHKHFFPEILENVTFNSKHFNHFCFDFRYWRWHVKCSLE